MKMYIDLHLSPVAITNVVFVSNRPTQGGLEETDSFREQKRKVSWKGKVLCYCGVQAHWELHKTCLSSEEP